MTMPLPPRAREIQARVRAFVDAELIPWEVHAEMHDGLVPDDVWQRMKAKAKEAGLDNMDMSVGMGGRGYSKLEQAVAQEQTGRVTNALGWCSNNPQSWMLEACSPEQIERWIKPLMRDERHECYAITEAEAGSDVDAIQATAQLVGGDHYILNGEKWHVTSANLADFMFFQAKITDGPNKGSHALFFVDQGTPGVEVVRTPAYTHNYRAHHPIYRFTDVRVPVSHRIGQEGAGMDFTYAWFRHERLMIAARCCGAADRLIEEATAFARSRIVFGKPLAEQQAVQFMLADSVTELFAARLITYETARAIDAGVNPRGTNPRGTNPRGADLKTVHAQCAMAKLYASEMAGRVADRAVQIFGGRGYMRENVAERFYRELRVDRIWEGASEIQRMIIANGLLKRGAGVLVG